METIYPAKPKIVTLLPFTEEACIPDRGEQLPNISTRVLPPVSSPEITWSLRVVGGGGCWDRAGDMENGSQEWTEISWVACDPWVPDWCLTELQRVPRTFRLESNVGAGRRLGFGARQVSHKSWPISASVSPSEIREHHMIKVLVEWVRSANIKHVTHSW